MNLVTGGNGFIGAHLVQALHRDGNIVRSLSRRPQVGDFDCVQGDLSDPLSLRVACAGVHTVFHCAGYAHAFNAASATEAETQWQVNFEGTRHLLEAAATAGVKVFVFLSSVKAMADPGDVCVDENWPGEPDSDYGRAKRAAELVVLEAGRHYGMRVTNLRLSMVYGAGGRGNLERMARLVGQGWFPPLPETGNRRSLIHVSDVVDAVRLVAVDPRADGKTYILAGPDSPSGRELYNVMRKVLGFRAIGWSVPLGALRLAAGVGDVCRCMLGRRVPLDSEALARLVGSACYSPRKIERELGWCPKVRLIDGLNELLASVGDRAALDGG